MGTEIVRIDGDPIRFCVWNTTADGPETKAISYDETIEHMRAYHPDAKNRSRVDRARETGTSALWYELDENSGFVYNQEGYIKLSKLGEFLDSYNKATNTYDLTLLEPLDQ